MDARTDVTVYAYDTIGLEFHDPSHVPQVYVKFTDVVGVALWDSAVARKIGDMFYEAGTALDLAAGGDA